MKRAILAIWCALALMAAPLAAQTGSGSGSGGGSGRGQTKVQDTEKKAAEAVAVTTKIAETQGRPVSRFVTTLTNVQVELTLTDQVGNAASQKKTVSMIVSSGNWGKIRNTAARIGPTQIGLNVDARPLVSIEGPIQLELTLYYYPPQGDPKEPGTPTELNQSLTVVLQSGKPLTISQAADPVTDRKVVVEVKATVLK